MASVRVERRLAAIVAADIVGYSHLVETDEAKTLESIRTLRREAIDPLLAEHRGRLVKLMGDGILAEFGSVVDAVACSVAIQNAVAAHQAGAQPDRRIVFRIGINLGDLVVEGEDLLGDGINIAARLEAIAEPGGICITDTVHRQLTGKTGLAFDDVGERSLKNIARPVRIWRWTKGPAPAPVSPSLPEKPSIAVLPFTNMSGDPEQEFFSDGITEDIITELSRYKSLFVVARHSSFVFRDRAADIREVGKALGVRVVLEGSVRKAGGRIRVTAQLIDAVSGEHLWADRYDGDLVDVFALQDEISRTIVSTIADRLDDSNAGRLAGRPTSDLTAYEQLLRGQKYLHQYSKEDYDRARACFQGALSSDPAFARAHGFLAIVEAYGSFWESEPLPRLELTLRIAEEGLALDQHETKCHLALGLAHLFRSAHDKAGYHLYRASELNPNDDLIMVECGRYEMYVGRPQEGADLVRRAMRRNPYHPNWYWNILGRCLHTAAAFDEAVSAFGRTTTSQFWTHAYLAGCHAELGRAEEAAEQVRKTLALKPEFTVTAFSKLLPYRNAEDLKRLLDSLRHAGLPE